MTRRKGFIQKIIEDDGTQPNGLEARNKIALIELRGGSRERAEMLIDEVLDEESNNENALVLRASFQISDIKVDDAIGNLRTVLRDRPDSVKALVLLGEAYEAKGSRELAIESYSRAYQINPGFSVVANRLARYYLLERKPQRAEEILQNSCNSGNRSAEALTLLIQAKLALGDWDTAETLAKQLQKVAGQETISLQLLGVIYKGREQHEASVEAFKIGPQIVT